MLRFRAQPRGMNGADVVLRVLDFLQKHATLADCVPTPDVVRVIATFDGSWVVIVQFPSEAIPSMKRIWSHHGSLDVFMEESDLPTDDLMLLDDPKILEEADGFLCNVIVCAFPEPRLQNSASARDLAGLILELDPMYFQLPRGWGSLLRCRYLRGEEEVVSVTQQELQNYKTEMQHADRRGATSSSSSGTLLMSVPEPHEAKEASPVPKLGVSVSLLLATYQRWEAAGCLAAGATTDDVVRDLVKPATADQKCSYLELLARSQDPQDRAGVATATVFLSHAWKYTFKQVVEAIAAHWPDKDNVRSQTFLWFDIFTVNQHKTSTVDPYFCSGEHPDDRNPVPLTRSWCLWEIFCTRITKASFEICLSPTVVTDFEHTLVNDFKSILGSLSSIDVKKAEAFKKEDQERILALVEAMEGGAHELNKAVLAEMRAWVVQAGRDALKAREGGSRPGRPTRNETGNQDVKHTEPPQQSIEPTQKDNDDLKLGENIAPGRALLRSSLIVSSLKD
eukprot:g73850.t1